MAMEKSLSGKVKRCRIHDLLHSYCLEKSKQDNFFTRMNRGEDMLPEKPRNYRLFIHSYQDENDLWAAMSLKRPFKLVKVLTGIVLTGGTFPSEGVDVVLSPPWSEISIIGELRNLEILSGLSLMMLFLSLNAGFKPSVSSLRKSLSHFGDAISLKALGNRCGWSVANSALEIQTTQEREDMANDAFTVTIQPPD
ncbi:hypothetical protein HAX54_032738 [Datura stramonium]|uniref:Uncharacterized protein n=1 Tax=Datura stramonium TaxID=4076 RepID=A0ABS8SCU1_DATST|nr:hypothetical protein [Datura stramonium]